MLKKYLNTEQIRAMQTIYFFDKNILIKDCIYDKETDTIYFLVDRMPKFRILDVSQLLGKKLFFLVDEGREKIFKKFGIEKIEIKDGKIRVYPKKIPKPILLLILRNYIKEKHK